MPSSKPRTQDLQDIQNYQYKVLTLERRDKLHRQRLPAGLADNSVARYLLHSWYNISKHSTCRCNQPIIDR